MIDMFMSRLKPLSEVFKIIDSFPRISHSEAVDIRDSLGRVLYMDIVADKDVPPFDRAAMDGYAVVADDTKDASAENPVALKVVGESDIGSPFSGDISSGEAVYVHTGSKIPRGANAVVPIEYVTLHGDRILIRRSVAPYENVSRRGEDIKSGTKILRRGHMLEPYDISLLKSLGYQKIKVFSKPRIGVVAVGNELVDSMDDLDEGKILEYSREIIIGYAKLWGGCIVDYGIVRDDRNEIMEIVRDAKKDADILVTVGGTSVGKRDLIPEVIKDNGELLFHGVAIEPGKPVCGGLIDGFPVLGFPGLPVATFVATITIFRRYIEHASNILGSIEFPSIAARLRRRIWSKPNIRTFARVRLFSEGNIVYAEPIMISGSGVLSSVVMSDGIVEVPENLEGYEAGSDVRVILIRHLQSSWVLPDA